MKTKRKKNIYIYFVSQFLRSSSSRRNMSTMDFCEPKYAVSKHIAQDANPLSTAVISVCAATGRYLHVPTARSHANECAETYRADDIIMRALWFALGTIGIGSGLFHAYLSTWTQSMDELPMICLVHTGILSILPLPTAPTKDATYPRLRPSVVPTLALWCVSLLVLVATYLLSTTYGIFLLLFCSEVAWLQLYLVRYLFYCTKSPPLRVRYGISGAMLLVASMAWYCDYLCFTQRVNFHVLWHVLSGICGSLYIDLLVRIRNHMREHHLMPPASMLCAPSSPALGV